MIRDMIETIYKIDHYYSTDHDSNCLLIKSDIEPELLIKILASIQFKFEELIDNSICASQKHILEILKIFFNVEDVKDQYKKYLPCTHILDGEWEVMNTFYIKDNSLKIIQIDLYLSREIHCGPNYKNLMKEVLPNDSKLEDFIKNTKEFYKEEFYKERF